VVRLFEVHVGDWMTVHRQPAFPSVFFFIYFLSYPQINAVEQATNYRFAFHGSVDPAVPAFFIGARNSEYSSQCQDD
jgi:hypothetical protein